jgi:L-seryl-tRNA(Ser) seleniumtransferase
MTLAAFDATLKLYLSGKRKEIPVIRMLETDKSILLERARRLCRILKRRAARLDAGDFTISVVETEDAVGGGAFPTDTLPGYGAALRSSSIGAQTLAARLRAAPFPVISAIREGCVVLHVRTLLDGDEKRIASAFTAALSVAPAAPAAIH